MGMHKKTTTTELRNSIDDIEVLIIHLETGIKAGLSHWGAFGGTLKLRRGTENLRNRSHNIGLGCEPNQDGFKAARLASADRYLAPPPGGRLVESLKQKIGSSAIAKVFNIFLN